MSKMIEFEDGGGAPIYIREGEVKAVETAYWKEGYSLVTLSFGNPIVAKVVKGYPTEVMEKLQKI